MAPRINLVRCKVCNKVIGADPVLKTIEKCIACHRGKGKKEKAAASPFINVKGGPAPDLPKKYKDKNYSFRSGWERNFARWLCANGIDWTFEEKVYEMKINPDTGKWYRRKPWGYLPDFIETESGTIWEVKGYFKPSDRSKLRRFRKHYPEDFKKLKVCTSATNKKGIKFYSSAGVPIILYEDIKIEYKELVSKEKDKWE